MSRYPWDEPDLPFAVTWADCWKVAVGVPVMFWAFAVIFTVIRLVGK